jgi:hypothetical protein
MAWTLRNATNYLDLLNQVRQFTQKAFSAGAVTAGGGNTGDGTVYGASASENSVAETWTITCTTGGGNGTAVFSVSGSVSGAQASATAGIPYSINETSFAIISGDTDFVATDSFTYSIAASTAKWVQDRWNTDWDGSGGYELIQHGTGSGTDEIYVGYQSRSDYSTYYNLSGAGMTGYVSGNDYNLQPGFQESFTLLNNSTIPFYCIFDGYHIKIASVFTTTNSGGSYLGWNEPYASPSQWTYPMFVGGSYNSAAGLIGDTSSNHTQYWADSPINAYVFDATVVRSGIKIYPRDYSQFTSWRAGIEGNMRLYPATPVHEGSTNVFGPLRGVYWPTPYTPSDAVLGEGDIVFGTPVGGVDVAVCVTLRDVFRTGAGNIGALELLGD